jgi:hypothetical protein
MAGLLEWLRLNWMLVTIILVIVGAFVFLRSSPTKGVDSLDDLNGVVTAGQPVILDFYSNF